MRSERCADTVGLQLQMVSGRLTAYDPRPSPISHRPFAIKHQPSTSIRIRILPKITAAFHEILAGDAFVEVQTVAGRR